MTSAAEPPPAAAADQHHLAADAERELRENILPFWLEHARDRARGGFVGRIGPDMRVDAAAPRGVLLTSRILWTFSAAEARFRRREYREMADWALEDLMRRGWDPVHGGLFWTVSAGGEPVDGMKHIYGQAFGMYGLSEYYRATRHRPALDRAIEIYRLLESRARDRKNGGYIEAFTRDWRRDDPSGQRTMGGHGPKSQNAHLHMLEAYANLYRAWPDEGLRRDLVALLELILDRIIDPKTHHLGLFFRDDWTKVSTEISFGHDIELSWLMVEAAQAIGDPALLKRVEGEALAIATAALKQGLDTDGAMFNEAGPNGLTNSNKDWWLQAEAVVGFLNAYQLSGDPAFLTASRRTWDFIQAKVVDRVHGDWYEAVSRDGRALERPKLSVWKCPYHNGRACLEIVERAKQSTLQK